MNLKKTFFALLFIAWMCRNEFKNVINKSILILLSNNIVLNQWFQNLFDWFSNVKMIICHEQKVTQIKHADIWISINAIKQASKTLNNWSKKFRYIFDEFNSNAFKTIILFIYDT